MAFHRWGEGMTARWVAFATLALFAVWGPAAAYWWPKQNATILERGEAVLGETWERLEAHGREGGPATIELQGLTSQPLAPELKGRKVLVDIRSAGGGLIARTGEELDDAKISHIRNAGFSAVPIKDEPTQAVEERIVSVCTTDERVTGTRVETQHIKGRGKDAQGDPVPGTKVTPENIEDLTKRLEEANPPLGIRKAGEGPKVWRTDADGKEGAFELRQLADLRVGDEFMADVQGLVTEVLAPPDTLIDRALYERLKAAGVKRVRVKDGGTLAVSAATKSALTGWYVTSNDQIEQATWWTTPLFLVPLLDWSIDWGSLVCALVALVLVYLSWWHLNKPHVTDALIDTQAEMKKVSWPSSRELVGSSVVVIAFIVVIGVFLFGADVVFAALTRLMRIFPPVETA